ncbi:cisplatin damage response ATP-dependent DNA ligase [Beijerinckia indica]|uniref:DNA ligase (ATP) n=1 Tax=Beijerinckia indica subsp. indica (strain ATCC 9039 / DSM 1715 / NCIMB 8712) TaxID=395963 RepID=B2IIM1_BEII9|nr:cisplatin damage response ATP-dependent DNA ligase [Beijerinckia indica]ACB94714.1 ATP dependent DNA ligase [Beijerinckia indica subsp. indica ATCC 9039]
MKPFTTLLDRLSFEHSRTNKLRLLRDFFANTPDPERGYALAALTGSLSFQQAKPGLLRTLIATRVDSVLFDLSYDFVGDLSETIALLWPTPTQTIIEGSNQPPLLLSEVVEGLRGGKLDLPTRIASWLDALDETGRWALLKLITGALRIGVSARLAKTALAEWGGQDVNEIEAVWHGLEPPYLDLFAWLEGREARPNSKDPAPFHPAMLAHAITEQDFATLHPHNFRAEWKWDGIRVQAVIGHRENGVRITRLYTRTGEEISKTFPDLVEALDALPFDRFAIDGELLILRDHHVQPFSVLQQRLNRKTVSAKLLADFPAHIRAYDLLGLNGEDLRPLPFLERRARLTSFVETAASHRLDLSPMIPFDTFEDLAAARSEPEAHGAGDDAEAVEGVMLKEAHSIYIPGRPKGLWYKWKRDPFTVDAVLMYAQRGHGKRSSLYSDYTFGVWRGDPDSRHDTAQLVPVGKAYSGFTDEELHQLDHYVRAHTINRFGPVRVVEHGKDDDGTISGLVLEIAFEGLNRSSRHKSGLAMRFPRINRIRWDKPAHEADRIESLEILLPQKQNAEKRVFSPLIP